MWTVISSYQLDRVFDKGPGVEDLSVTSLKPASIVAKGIRLARFTPGPQTSPYHPNMGWRRGAVSFVHDEVRMPYLPLKRGCV